MANQEHLDILKQGVEAWNEWRKQHSEIEPDLSFTKFKDTNLSGIDFSRVNLMGANFSETDLSYANLNYANLSQPYPEDEFIRDLERDIEHVKKPIGDDFHKFMGANLSRANLSYADLKGANLRGVILREADLESAHLDDARLIFAILSGANLRGTVLNFANLVAADLSGAKLLHAKLRDADLRDADLTDADLSGADLTDANLSRAILIETNMRNATLTGCSIYGISAWGVELEGAIQDSLIITPPPQGEQGDVPTITVDNLEVAQFIYLLLNNIKIREVIDTITSKVVLILGRFTPERKVVLEAIREELRKHDYLPVLFDFDPPRNRDLTETVSILARLARFVIADLTDPNSIPHELYSLIPDLRNIPFQPLLEASKKEYPMFEAFWSYPWVLPIRRYSDSDLLVLIASLKEDVIDPAEEKVNELAREKAKRLLGQ